MNTLNDQEATSIMTYDEEMIARTAIQHLQAIYNNAGDRGKVDDMLTAFASDGVLDIESETFAGHEAIKGFIGKIASGQSPTHLVGARHHLTTSRFEIDGEDKARAWTYFFVMRRCEFLHEGTYVDHYARIDGRWLITHRRFKIVHDAEITAG